MNEARIKRLLKLRKKSLAFALIITMFILAAGSVAHAQAVEHEKLAVNKKFYVKGEQVYIKTTLREAAELLLRYNGKEILLLNNASEFSHLAAETGSYTLVALEKGTEKVLAEISFIVAEPLIPEESVQPDEPSPNITVELDKNEYKLGEAVLIKIKGAQGLQEGEIGLNIFYKELVYSYLGSIKEGIQFTPREPGSYIVQVFAGKDVFFEKEILVIAEEQTSKDVPQEITQVTQLQVLDRFDITKDVSYEFDFNDRVPRTVFLGKLIQLTPVKRVQAFAEGTSAKILKPVVENTGRNKFRVTLPGSNEIVPGIYKIVIYAEAGNSTLIDEKTFEWSEDSGNFRVALADSKLRSAALSADVFANGAVSQDKGNYTIGDAVLISINSSGREDLKLHIISETRTYIYIGLFPSQVKFFPREAGNFTVVLSSGSEVLGSSQFQAYSKPTIPPGFSGAVYIEQSSYSIGDIVKLYATVNLSKLDIAYGDEVYSFIPANYTEFVPFGPGVYYVDTAHESGGRTINERASFSVGESSVFTETVAIEQDAEFDFDFFSKIEKKTVIDKLFQIGSITEISAYVEGYEGNLTPKISNLGKNRYNVKVPWVANVSEGIHTLVVTAKAGEQIITERKKFNWGLTNRLFADKAFKLHFRLAYAVNLSKIEIRGREKAAEAAFKIYRKSLDGSLVPVNESDIFKNETFTFEVEPLNKHIKKILFNEFNFSGNLVLGIDDVKAENVSLELPGHNIKKAFAIDPGHAIFKNAILSTVASGNVLYKCKDWNFSSQSCYGEWTKAANITPGVEYNISITKNDPGFAELSQIQVISNLSNTTRAGNLPGYWYLKKQSEIEEGDFNGTIAEQLFNASSGVFVFILEKAARLTGESHGRGQTEVYRACSAAITNLSDFYVRFSYSYVDSGNCRCGLIGGLLIESYYSSTEFDRLYSLGFNAFGVVDGSFNSTSSHSNGVTTIMAKPSGDSNPDFTGRTITACFVPGCDCGNVIVKDFTIERS